MDWFTLTYACTCILLAAFVRGFSGFGFSLIAIPGLSLVYPVADIVPTIFLMEIAATLHMLPSIWKDIHWRSLFPLIMGCVFATPLGIAALAWADPALMKLALAIFVLLAVALMLHGFALKRFPGPIATTMAGAASGLCNGAFGIGGPPVIMFYFSSPAGNAVGRASIAAFFFFTDLIGLLYATPAGLVSKDTFFRAAIFLIPLIIGVWIGGRKFKTMNQDRFRRYVLYLLGAMAIAIAAQVLFASI